MWPLGSTSVQGLASAYRNRFMLRGSVGLPVTECVHTQTNRSTVRAAA